MGERPAVSVILRARTDHEEILDVIEALADQTQAPNEFVVIDSGSSPDLLDRFRAFRDSGVESPRHGSRIPFRLIEIPSAEYQSARALNVAIGEARGPLLAIISQDATPDDEHYLERLSSCFVDDSFAASYARQIGRPGCEPLTRKDLEKSYPAVSRDQSAPDCWLANSASMVRRDLWEQQPFDERAKISEDHEWARWAQDRGYKVRYEADAVVRHSHDSGSPSELWRRFFGEGCGLAYIRGNRLSLPHAAFHWIREVGSDARWLLRGGGSLLILPRSTVLRAVKHFALYRGLRAGLTSRETPREGGLAAESLRGSKET